MEIYECTQVAKDRFCLTRRLWFMGGETDDLCIAWSLPMIYNRWGSYSCLCQRREERAFCSHVLVDRQTSLSNGDILLRS